MGVCGSNMKNILTILTIIAITIQTHNIGAEELSTKSIQKDIKVLGARKVYISLYDDVKKWHDLLRKIASGDEEWLKVAINLRDGSDAGASEMLSLAVGEALEHNPENVFKFALNSFEINVICGGPDVDDQRYDSYELAIKAINKRINKVSSVKGRNLKEKCNECLRHLSEAKKHIANFFQVNEQDH